jgi:hypothetical protein
MGKPTWETIVIVNAGQTPDVLRNDGGNRLNSLLIRTVGAKCNRDGIGARLKLTIGKKVLIREVKAGSGYLGQNDRRVHFGLGAALFKEGWPKAGVVRSQTTYSARLTTPSGPAAQPSRRGGESRHPTILFLTAYPR